MTSITIYTFIVYSGRTIKCIIACTPFASVWWGLGGIWWLINYRKIQQEKVAKIEARREEQAARDAMARKSDQAVEVVFKLEDMISVQ